MSEPSVKIEPHTVDAKTHSGKLQFSSGRDPVAQYIYDNSIRLHPQQTGLIEVL